MPELLLLVVGVVVGIVADELYTAVKSRLGGLRERRAASNFARSTDPVSHAENVSRIFADSGREHLLYRLATLSPGPLLPVMPDPADSLVGTVNPASDLPFRLVSTERDELPYRKSLVRVMQRAGLNLWDGAICYAPPNPFEDSTLMLRVCNFFAYVDRGNRVLAESRKVTGEKPILGALQSFETALSGHLLPSVVSVAATCVFDDGHEKLVALHRRSNQVVNARGLVGVAPNFVVEPNTVGGERSRFGILTYNLLKEVVEEFFDDEEVVHAGDQLRPSPDWVFRTDAGVKLINELDSGRLTITCTGTCIDLSDGALITTVLAHFTSPEYLREVKLSTRGSWEAAAADGPLIKFLPIESPEVDQLLAGRDFIGSSAFSLDRARLVLREGR